MPHTTHTRPLAPMLALCLVPIMRILSADAHNYLLFTIGTLSSLIIDAALIAIINTSNRPQNLPCPLYAVTALFFLAASAYAVGELVRVSGFLSQHRTGEVLISLPLILAGLYAASLSQGAQSRLSAAVLLTVTAVYGVTALMALKNGTLSNLHIYSTKPLDDAASGFLSGAVTAFPAVYYLLARITGSERVSAGRFVLFKGGLMLLFTLPVIFVLGEHIRYSKLPAYDLAAFSKSVVIERFNGLYVLILTLASALMTALGLGGARVCLAHIVRERGVTREKA